MHRCDLSSHTFPPHSHSLGVPPGTTWVVPSSPPPPCHHIQPSLPVASSHATLHLGVTRFHHQVPCWRGIPYPFQFPGVLEAAAYPALETLSGYIGHFPSLRLATPSFSSSSCSPRIPSTEHPEGDIHAQSFCHTMDPLLLCPDLSPGQASCFPAPTPTVGITNASGCN